MPEGARRQEGCRGTYISGSLKIAWLRVHCDADLHAVQQQSLLTSNGQDRVGADGDLHMQQPFQSPWLGGSEDYSKLNCHGLLQAASWCHVAMVPT